MKIENVKKCLKCGKTFHGFNSCPFCGSTKVEDTGEVVEVEIKKFKKVEEKIELTAEEKEKRKKHAFKRNIILSAAGALMILIVMLCIFLVYIPNNTQKLEITSFDGNTTLVIEDFKLGKNVDSIYGGQTIEVLDRDKFYEKYLKQYTVDEFESTKEKGYLFYEGTCFYYYSDRDFGFYRYVIRTLFYDADFLGTTLQFIVPNHDYFEFHKYGFDYQGHNISYARYINFLSHVDDRYYKVQDGKYYLKAYTQASTTEFEKYIELRKIDKYDEYGNKLADYELVIDDKYFL